MDVFYLSCVATTEWSAMNLSIADLLIRFDLPTRIVGNPSAIYFLKVTGDLIPIYSIACVYEKYSVIYFSPLPLKYKMYHDYMIHLKRYILYCKYIVYYFFLVYVILLLMRGVLYE